MVDGPVEDRREGCGYMETFCTLSEIFAEPLADLSDLAHVTLHPTHPLASALHLIAHELTPSHIRCRERRKSYSMNAHTD